MERLLWVEKLNIAYGQETVVRDVSFSLEEGKILCLAGESGSGKSTVLKALTGIDPSVQAEGGIFWRGENMIGRPYRERRRLCGRSIAVITQDPGSSFHPVRPYGAQLKEMLKSLEMYDREAFRRDVREIFCKLGLEDWERILKSCPYEMSGGMNQRIAIGAVMLLRPQLLLADEPTSALDVTVQKQTAIELLRLREAYGISQIIVTHNLGLAAFMADQIGIMQKGRLIEYGAAREILSRPKQEYTRQLLKAVPRLPEEG
ncbi:MAG: ABC transporter ATP-binding protein [Eubacteriales bacterium]|nr:ABC transporter ATP-binding protein [Eubacteriales bacterium]